MRRVSVAFAVLVLAILGAYAQETERHGGGPQTNDRRVRTTFTRIDITDALNAPRYTDCANYISPFEGDLCYDMTDDRLEVYDGAAWVLPVSGSLSGTDSLLLNSDTDGDDTGKYQFTPIDNSEGRQLDQKGYDDASSGPFHSYPWPEFQIWNPRQSGWTRPTFGFVVGIPDYTEYPSETEWEGAWPTGDSSAALRLIANETRQAGTYAGISLELEGSDPANTAPHETVSIWGAKAYDRQAQFVVRMQTDFDEDGTLDRSDYGYPDKTFPQSPFNNLLGTATGDDMRDLPWVTMRLSQAYDSRIDSADPNWGDVRPGAGDHGAGVWFVFKDLAPEPSYATFYPQQYSSIALVPDYDACNPDVDGDNTLEETTQFAIFTEEFHSPISLGSNYESFHLCLANIPDKRSNDTIPNQWTFDAGIITSSILSQTGEALVLDSANGTVRMPDYVTCNIETDASGNLVCGVDDTGGTGGSPSGGSGAVQLSDGVGSFDDDIDNDGTTDLTVSGGNNLYLDGDADGVVIFGSNKGVGSAAWSANHRKNRVDIQIKGGSTSEAEVRHWYDAQISTTTGNGRVMKTIVGSKDYFIELDRFDYGFDYGFDYTAGFGVSHPNSTDLVLYAPSLFGENTNTKLGSDADVDGDGTVDRWDEIHARIAKFTEQLFITDQTNCDTVDTDANGELACGTDDDVPDAGDFGAATDLDANGALLADTVGPDEVADGTDNPADGECIKYSASSSSFYYDACGGGGSSTIQLAHWTLLDPASGVDALNLDAGGDTYLGPNITDASTVTEVTCAVDLGQTGESCTVDILEVTSAGVATTVEANVSASNTGTTSTAIDDGAIAAGNYLALDIDSCTGTISQLICTVWGTTP